MSTESATKPAFELPFNGEALVSYLDKFGEQQKKLGTAVKAGYERSQRISTQLIEALITGQQELIELTKKVVQKPQDYSNNLKAMVEASTVAQGRALDLAKALYREQADVASELGKTFKTTCQSTALTEASRNIVNFWIKPR